MPGVDLLSQAPGVIILGGDQVGKKALIERLPGTSASATEASGAMLLDTKYYTALVRLNIVNHSESPDQEYEGVILVFDATRWWCSHFTILSYCACTSHVLSMHCYSRSQCPLIS